MEYHVEKKTQKTFEKKENIMHFNFIQKRQLEHFTIK